MLVKHINYFHDFSAARLKLVREMILIKIINIQLKEKYNIHMQKSCESFSQKDFIEVFHKYFLNLAYTKKC